MYQNNGSTDETQQKRDDRHYSAEALQELNREIEGLRADVKEMAGNAAGSNGDSSTRTAQAKQDGEITIDLVGFLFRLLERFWLIVLAAAIGTVGAWIYAQSTVPTYAATSKLYIVSQSDSLIKFSDLQLGTALANDYLEVFKAWELHEMVRQELNLNYSYSQMQSMIGVSNPKDTRIVSITAVHPNPQMAADIANAYAQAAKTYITSTMQCEEPTDFSVARVPTSPLNTRKSTKVLTGFLLGTALMVGVLFLQYMFDDRPKSPDDIMDYAGIPTLAILPTVDTEWSAPRRKKLHKTTKQESQQ